MTDARRAARRVRVPGIQVSYESATGERRQARAVDLSREGLFIPSASPPAVGKRLLLEIQPIGEPIVWSALGRVVWVRGADDGHERPAGMAVKFVDVEDTVVAAIERLLEAREPTQRGLGLGAAILPLQPARSSLTARDRTRLGVGPEATAIPAAPIVIAAPGGEPTLTGVEKSEGSAKSPEGGRAIDLVVPKDRTAPAPVLAPLPVTVNESDAATAETSSPTGPQGAAVERSVVEPAAKRSFWGVAVLFALIIAAGVAGYAVRDRIRAISHAAVSTMVKRLP